MEEKKLLVNGGYPLHTYEDVYEVFSTYITNQKDRDDIRKAYEFILKKHEGQFRKSGEPYYHHLVEVAYICASLHCGPTAICAAFLHDTVEDTDTTVKDIEKIWGKEVARLVDSLTKIQRLKLSKIQSEEFEAEDHRKILIGMAKDIRVILVKLADRLHNLRTLSSLKEERQMAISKETMEVFVPIAHRLGLEAIKSEMQDICLSYLEPEKYKEVVKLLSKKAKSLNKSLEGLKKKIADLLFDKGIPFDISSRVKSIYSIYSKMYLKGHPFNEIYDILAIRIITDSEIRCYEILGLIHQMYRPIPGRFKDYIAMPKPNLYQSLHTTVISGDGNIFEVQIRTQEMDDVAESGVAAHWAYKEGSGYNSKKEQLEIENKLHWFRDFVSVTDKSQDGTASEFIDSLTHDIFEANIYVFTPKGKVIELPQGSTPVDFAYRIHTKVGDSTVGALVNSIMVPLNTVLKTGDMVEIKTSKTSPGPSEGWLDFVKTASAKQNIKKYVAKKNSELLREEKIAKGHQSCLDAFKDRGVDEEEMMKYLDNSKLLQHFEVDNVDDLFIAVTNRKPTTNSIIEYLHLKKEFVFHNNNTGKAKTKSGDDCPVYAKGAGKIAITLANCCTPIPGDNIVGFTTRGKGISVHRSNCPNIINEKQRLIEVFWRDDLEFATYPVDVLIEANDRNNLLVDIMNKLSSAHVSMVSMNARINHNNLNVTFTTTLMVSDAKRLSDIFNIILNINGVFRVERIIH